MSRVSSLLGERPRPSTRRVYSHENKLMRSVRLCLNIFNIQTFRRNLEDAAHTLYWKVLVSTTSIATSNAGKWDSRNRVEEFVKDQPAKYSKRERQVATNFKVRRLERLLWMSLDLPRLRYSKPKHAKPLRVRITLSQPPFLRGFAVFAICGAPADDTQH